jgi:hypothetical protein
MSELKKCLNALEAMSSPEVRKSISGQHLSQGDARAILIAKASETPAGAVLARRILRLEQQAVQKANYAWLTKQTQADPEESGDEWSREFSEADGEEDDFSNADEVELRRQLAEVHDLERKLNQAISARHFGRLV